MEFKDRIEKLRNSKSLTHAQLAIALDKSEAAIRAWESGRTKPDADTIIRISEYFKCSTDFLLGLSSSRRRPQFSSSARLAAFSAKKVSSLDVSERAYVLDIVEQMLTCLEEFKYDEQARDIFLTCFFSLFMDFRLCISHIADHKANGGDKDMVKTTFYNIRDVADMDYKDLWEKLECLLEVAAKENEQLPLQAVSDN